MVQPAARWENIEWPEEKPQTSDWIGVLPLGAHEQHGPHLPPQTDTLIARGIVDATIAALPDDLPVSFLPVEEVGYSIEHLGLGETRTLSFEAAVNRWIGIAEMLHTRGIRKFLMLNAHGGNSPLMTIVATEVRQRFAMLAVSTSWTRFGLPPDTISDREKAIGIHAGEIETSVMLALYPDLVDMTKAQSFPSFQEDLYRDADLLRAYGPHAFGWKMSDLNSDGAAGNARAATARKGKKLIDHSVAGIITLLRDIDAFDLGHFE